MEFKTCEERVLKELAMAEDKVLELEKKLKDLQGPLAYADETLGICKQILTLEEGVDGKFIIGARKMRALDPKNAGDNKVIMYLKALLHPEEVEAEVEAKGEGVNS